MRRCRPSPIGVRLRRLREAAGLSQRELSRLAGLSEAYARMLENGWIVAPSIDAVAALAAALGADCAALAFGTARRPRAAEAR